VSFFFFFFFLTAAFNAQARRWGRRFTRGGGNSVGWGPPSQRDNGNRAVLHRCVVVVPGWGMFAMKIRGERGRCKSEACRG